MVGMGVARGVEPAVGADAGADTAKASVAAEMSVWASLGAAEVTSDGGAPTEFSAFPPQAAASKITTVKAKPRPRTKDGED
jgi:hypothetical protein